MFILATYEKKNIIFFTKLGHNILRFFMYSIIISECVCQISFDRIMFEKKHVQTKGNWIYGQVQPVDFPV